MMQERVAFTTTILHTPRERREQRRRPLGSRDGSRRLGLRQGFIVPEHKLAALELGDGPHLVLREREIEHVQILPASHCATAGWA